MKMKGKISFRRFLIFILMMGSIFSLSFPVDGETYRVLSPDEDIELQILFADTIEYSVFHKSRPLLLSSPISFILYDGEVLGEAAEMIDVSEYSVNEVIHPVIREKRSRIAGCSQRRSESP